MVEKNKNFQVVAHIVMIFLALCCIFPFALLIMSSITEENELIRNGYTLFPAELSMNAYLYMFKSGTKIVSAYLMTIFSTVVGTSCGLSMTVLMAYALSRRGLPGRNVMAFYVFFTMLFNGGIVPSYLLWTSLGVKDTIFAQLLPNFLVSAWNVMMIRTFFTTSIPDSLYEAAEIDGASQMKIFTSIVIPLGKPILVTMGTFAGLTYWNDWTNGLYYLVRNKNLYNVQNLLNQMVTNIQYLASSSNSNVASAASAIPSTAIQMAIAFVAILPIMLIFPFFQKYYSKGLTLGGVKG